MNLTPTLSSLLGIALFVAVVVLALKVAQSIFGADSKRAAATEVAAKLVSYPTASDGVLRRRFARALVTQHVVMPSGDRLAFSDLTVRVAPEDLERLDPDADLDRLGDDAAALYRTHAEREGWALPSSIDITVEVDPALRAGWIPPARGTRRREPVGVLGVAPRTEGARTEKAGAGDCAEHQHEDRPAWLGWDRVGQVVDADASSNDATATVTSLRRTSAGPETVAFSPPTVEVGSRLRLERGAEVAVLGQHEEVVLGRLRDSPLRFDEQEVSSRHVAVRWRAGHWQASDVGSTNGTMIDGEHLEQGSWTTLTSGAVIALAGVRVVVSVETVSTQTPSPGAGGTVRREGIRAHQGH
ncbi:FhaA domain-containing protein [Aeromicrobium sp. CTD01-1L150]|uniref:FhaA domain-containing protein n=1 Tax=Aeromicrobium sp. CTD01-1L150 TaxID=3341830 RepID=UPI0035C18F83